MIVGDAVTGRAHLAEPTAEPPMREHFAPIDPYILPAAEAERWPMRIWGAAPDVDGQTPANKSSGYRCFRGQ